MKKLVNLPEKITDEIFGDEGFLSVIKEFMNHDAYLELRKFPHHGNLDCLSHSVHVAFESYKIAKKFNLEWVRITRGAMLHDFYLYDWHQKDGRKGFHGITHPRTAFENANKIFSLTDIEADIILKHMWPLMPKIPKYKESWVIIAADKYCALKEYIMGWC